eukprot:TRINITY_DN8118_c0_g1_i3.p1 TRINITY_DN8118_c0_g1~~TRINITY_DN8118_c0_g1_i3.p1  ORF type:complete len:331 (+),score=73.31 TRINITY_DN8118_c0_g1_i3:57-1049(+)
MSHDNVTLAFALTIGAGLSTTIGSLAPIFKSLQSKQFLTAALAASAGVMLYVSFAEILGKAHEHLGNTLDEATAAWSATSSFFGGIFFCWGLHRLVHWMEEFLRTRESGVKRMEQKQPPHLETSSSVSFNIAMNEFVVNATHPSSADQLIDAERFQNEGNPSEYSIGSDAELNDPENIRLKQMGIMTAITIGLHNFPEGLATFVATLADPHLGVALAIAVALHNIPEGVCVSMPIYHATKSVKKAFLWSFVSGISEPIGAFVGWIALKDYFDDMVYGILFGIVAGMMVYVCISELIPTAIRYDTEQKGITSYIIGGMAIMALSILVVDLP